MDDADPPSALPRGTRLGEFEIRRVLGIGGFGIVYLAFDHALEREVAVKEYMPASLAGRTAALHVSLLSQAHAETFALGLKSFVNEARLLARFDHPALVKVHRYWEQNHTAYMAMPFYAGSNLHRVRQQMTAPPGEAWLRGILDALLGALERLHSEAVYHRDISPDNVIMLPDGKPVLLDFGAARRVISDKSMALTAILKPAYAPIEQYAEAGTVKQGPWTDLYALGATLHFLLLGKAPPPATARAIQDDAQPLAMMALPDCSPAFLHCVDWMLRPRPLDRPQSVAQLREVLSAQAEVPEPANAAWQRTQIIGAPVAPTQVMLRGDNAGNAPSADPLAPTLRVAAGAGAGMEPTFVVPRTGDNSMAPTQVVPSPASLPAEPVWHGDGVHGQPQAPVNPAHEAARAMPVMAGTASASQGAGGHPPSGLPAPAAASAGAHAAAANTPPANRPRWPLAVAAGVAVLAAVGWVMRPAPTTGSSVATPAAASAPAEVAPALANGGGASAAAAAPATTRVTAPAASSTVRTVTVGERPASATAAAPKAASGPATVLAGKTNPAATPASATGNRPAPSTQPAMPPTSVTTHQPAQEPVRTTGFATAAPPTPAAPASSSPAAPAKTAAVREADPMVQSRVLGPSERCEGRVLVAFFACVESQCKSAPELREHPECVKLRREREQRGSQY